MTVLHISASEVFRPDPIAYAQAIRLRLLNLESAESRRLREAAERERAHHIHLARRKAETERVRQERIDKILSADYRDGVSLMDLARAVAAERGLTTDDIFGPSQKRKPSAARQKLMWLALYKLNMPAFRIGKRLGRDHSTVLHGVRAHQARLDRGAA